MTRAGDSSADLVVYYAIKGSGRNGVDYATMKAHAKIKAGQTSRVFKVTATGDMGGVAKRTVKVSLSGNGTYSLGATRPLRSNCCLGIRASQVRSRP